MKKVLVLIAVIFLISGCKAEYNLVIEDDKYQETVTVNNLSLDENKSNLKNYNLPIYINEELKNNISSLKEDGVTYYDKKDLIYSHDFNMKDFYRSYFVNSAYNNVFMVMYDDKEQDSNKEIISIETGYDVTLFDSLKTLEEIDVKIKTNHKVKNCNGKDLGDNTYGWTLKKENTDNSVIMQIYKNEYVANYNNAVAKKTFLIIGIIVTIIAIGVVGYKITNKKNK